MLEALVEAVQESAKYRHVSEDLIRRVGARELAARRNLKEAIKETKNTLHQIAGAYLDPKMRYAAWAEELNAFSAAEDPERLRRFCRETMMHHASTRERLPFLETFYQETLGSLPPIRSVLDVACGLNPMSVPWMPLAAGATYLACDLFGDMRQFLNVFFERAGIAGCAEVRDVLSAPPTQEADVALVLKLLPLLDQADKAASRNLLRSLQARQLLVSFPTRSLGGQGKGMAAHYETRFHEIIAGETWQVERYVFPAELCFLVTK